MKGTITERAAAGAAIVVSSHLLALVEDLCTHLLILHKGQRLFYGSLDEARAHYADLQGDASLEEVFFRATDQRREPQTVVTGMNRMVRRVLYRETIGGLRMHAALAKLIALSIKASIRRSFRGARTVRGAFLLLFSFGVLALMIIPSLATAAMLRSGHGVPPFSHMGSSRICRSSSSGCACS